MFGDSSSYVVHFLYTAYTRWSGTHWYWSGHWKPFKFWSSYIDQAISPKVLVFERRADPLPKWIIDLPKQCFRKEDIFSNPVFLRGKQESKGRSKNHQKKTRTKKHPPPIPQDIFEKNLPHLQRSTSQSSSTAFDYTAPGFSNFQLP